MKKSIVIAAAAIVLVGGSAWYLVSRSSVTVPANCQTGQSGNLSIMYTGEHKFLPDCVTVFAGNQITYINNTSEELQIGADPHPIHTGNKEVSGGDFVLKIEPGQSAKVTLKKKGTFGFHNHKQSSARGVVIVK